MKKLIFLSLIILSNVALSAQQTVDVIMKSKALTEAGKTDQAINMLNQAIGQARDFRLYTGRAEANALRGNYSAAIADYNEANKITPGSGEYGLSRIYALKGDAATSVYHLELSMNSPFRHSEKEIMLDPAFGAFDNRQEWRQFWKKEWYPATEKAIAEIEYYISGNKLDQARQALDEFSKSSDSVADVIYARSLVNVAAGNYGEAVKDLSGISGDDVINEKYLRLQARARYEGSDPAGASNIYTKLIDSGVADASLFLRRAECFQKTGEIDKAVTDINKYLEIYPGDKNALSLAGKVEIKSGDNLKAINYFTENIKLHPEDPQCYIDRANSYFMSKSWDMAINDYSMSLDLKPGNSDAWLNMGIARLSEGKTDDACHDFRRALSLGNKRVADYIGRNCIK